MDDLIYIKSLIAERVREGGSLILNADDEHLARLMATPRVSRVSKRVIYFSLHDNRPLIKRHASAGGTAYFVRDDWIVEAEGNLEREVVRVSTIPATMGGIAEFNAANAMAAMAAARAYGLTVEQVITGLMSFSSEEHNDGRMNLYSVGRGYVLLDYGHNPAALKSVCHLATEWRGHRVTGIVRMPGDRCDELIEEAGRVGAQGFSRVIIKEDQIL